MQDEASTMPSYGVGSTLKGARETMGKQLSEVASQLRIRQPFLQALEDSRHKDLPGGTYAVGFLRTYAEFLGLDGEEIVRRFRAEAAGALDTRSELIFPSPVSEGRIPGGAVLFLGIVLTGVAYGAWYWLSAHDTNIAELVPTLPDRLASVLNRQAAVTGENAKPEEPAAKPDDVPPAKTAEPTATPPATADPLAAIPAKEEVVPPSEDDDGKPPGLVKSEPVKTEPVKVEPVKVEIVKAEPAKPELATAPAGKIIGQEHTDSRITLTATGDDCWVQIRELDGQLLLSRLLRRGDSYMVPNRAGLVLMVGNAGALDIAVDGKKTPSLGANGQVRRDIKLDVDKLPTGG